MSAEALDSSVNQLLKSVANVVESVLEKEAKLTVALNTAKSQLLAEAFSERLCRKRQTLVQELKKFTFLNCDTDVSNADASCLSVISQLITDHCGLINISCFSSNENAEKSIAVPAYLVDRYLMEAKTNGVSKSERNKFNVQQYIFEEPKDIFLAAILFNLPEPISSPLWDAETESLRSKSDASKNSANYKIENELSEDASFEVVGELRSTERLAWLVRVATASAFLADLCGGYNRIPQLTSGLVDISQVQRRLLDLKAWCSAFLSEVDECDMPHALGRYHDFFVKHCPPLCMEFILKELIAPALLKTHVATKGESEFYRIVQLCVSIAARGFRGSVEKTVERNLSANDFLTALECHSTFNRLHRELISDISLGPFLE